MIQQLARSDDSVLGKPPASGKAQKLTLDCPPENEEFFTTLPQYYHILRTPDRYLASSWLRGGIIAFVDVVAIALSLLLSFILVPYIRQLLGTQNYPHLMSSEATLAVCMIPLVVILWSSYRWGHYSKLKPFWDEVADLLKMLFYALTIVVLVVFMQKAHVSRLWIITSYGLLMVLCPVSRVCVKRFLHTIGRLRVPVFVIGDERSAEQSRVALESDYSLGYEVVAVFAMAAGKSLQGAGVRSEASQYASIFASVENEHCRYPNAHLLLCMDKDNHSAFESDNANAVIQRFEHIIVAQPMMGLTTTNAEVMSIQKFDTLFVRLSSLHKPFSRKTKRLFDIVVSFGLLVVLSPVFLLVGGLVKLGGGDVFFGSLREGRSGDSFYCYKFRTMYSDASARLDILLLEDEQARKEWATGFKLKNDPRITSLGRFLRSSSLDELPQLFNVLKGEMSLVGPRPILPAEAENYGSGLENYYSVRPGLTGLWQVSGRSNLSYEKRKKLNLWYTRNWSLWLDLVILLKTIPTVLKSSDAC